MKSKLISFFKKNTFIIMGIFVFTIFYIIYINNSTANIMFQDQFDLMYILDKYFSGTLTIYDLWRGHLEHRLFGYNIIFLLNAIIFKYNSYFEFYLGALSLAITAVLIYVRFKRYVKKEPIHQKVLFYSISVLILLIIFSLNQWENMVFSLGMYILLKMCFFVPLFTTVDDLLLKKDKVIKLLIFLFIWLGLSILVFGAGYSLAMVGGVVLILIFKAAVDKWRFTKKDILIYTSVLIISAVFLFIYYFNIYQNNMVVNRESNFDKIIYIFEHWPSAMKYLMLSFSASVFGVSFSDHYLTEGISVTIGILLLLVYVFAVYLYVKNKFYERTFIPLLFIFYSVLFYGMILVGRFDYGTSYGMASRYVTETQYGLIGVIWIIAMYILRTEKIQFLKFNTLIPMLCIVFIGVGQVLTNIEEVRISPYRQAYFLDLQRIAHNVDSATSEELAKFQYPEPLVRDGINTMKKYDLSIFKQHKEIVGIDGEGFVDGWYATEDAGRWMAKNATFVFSDDSKKSMAIKGNVPTVYDEIVLSVFLNNKEIVSKTLYPGDFNLELSIPSSSMSEIEFKLSKSFVPSEIKLNEDQRELGIFITNLSIE
ncbi:hypothetical protein [Paenibacillus typhae]|uniref:Uncharacterized protein n=1 Tax=Paenibacillus typhae TaxID=1174501 RepID=A0A1G8NKM6_9BACL|nr:hypothetical protein [Paenibacillus typhae]SDI80702.1 hypothetical protein SAMN05216192_108167 [Paenibacillus typhae]